MLAELSEPDARGEIAAIYDEIRHLCAVPYVSSMQRHLATRPGWLTWAWAAIAPAFRSGAAQETGWRLAGETTLPPLPALTRQTLDGWGIAADDEAAIRGVCDSFIRVSPTNLVFAGLLRRLLAGEQPGGKAPRDDWTPPKALPAPPLVIDAETLDGRTRDALLCFAADVGDDAYVPGIYRMLANWPTLLPYLAEHLAPRLDDPATRTACAQLADRIDAAVPEVLAAMPPLPDDPPMPPAKEHPAVLTALASYRRSSPQMVLFGRLIRDALPDAG